MSNTLWIKTITSVTKVSTDINTGRPYGLTKMLVIISVSYQTC